MHGLCDGIQAPGSKGVERGCGLPQPRHGTLWQLVRHRFGDANCPMKPIAVADYTLKKTLPKELKGELPSAAELKKQLKGEVGS